MGEAALLVFEGDWHTNSTIGLNPLTLVREMESRQVAGKAGRAMWRAHNQFWQRIASLREEYGSAVYTFLVGDLGDVNRKSKDQLITNSRSEVRVAMAEVADVAAQGSDYVFVVRGTETHTGGNGELEEDLARDIENAEWYSDSVASWWKVDADIGGKRLYVAHHPPTSSRRPWTLGQAVSNSASIVAARFMDDGDLRDKPDICVWAHAHTRGAQAYGMGNTWGFFLPPWQLQTGYSHRIGQGAGSPRVGGAWIVVRDGQVLDWGIERWRPHRAAVWTA